MKFTTRSLIYIFSPPPHVLDCKIGNSFCHQLLQLLQSDTNLKPRPNSNAAFSERVSSNCFLLLRHLSVRRFFAVLMECNGAGIVLYVTLLFVVAGSCGRLVNLKFLEDSRSNSTADQGRVADLHLHRGRLVIGQNSSWKRLPAANPGYQADMGT